MSIDFDPQTTERRYTQIREYMDVHVLNSSRVFCCSSAVACRRSVEGFDFAAGQLSHVGRHYDTFVDGQPLRVLVVAMDTGRSDEGVDLDQRRQQLYRSGEMRFTMRNPHMRGTTLALRALFSHERWSTQSDEFLAAPNRVRIFDAYAMANLRLCSAIEAGSTKSKGSKTMSQNCMRHLQATMEILDPTVIVVQGKGVDRELRQHLRGLRRIAFGLESFDRSGRRTLYAPFSHPSHPGVQNWSGATRPYFVQVVLPALRAARSGG